MTRFLNSKTDLGSLTAVQNSGQGFVTARLSFRDTRILRYSLFVVLFSLFYAASVLVSVELLLCFCCVLFVLLSQCLSALARSGFSSLEPFGCGIVALVRTCCLDFLSGMGAWDES